VLDISGREGRCKDGDGKGEERRRGRGEEGKGREAEGLILSEGKTQKTPDVNDIAKIHDPNLPRHPGRNLQAISPEGPQEMTTTEYQGMMTPRRRHIHWMGRDVTREGKQ